jgi:hypothetical protein
LTGPPPVTPGCLTGRTPTRCESPLIVGAPPDTLDGSLIECITAASGCHSTGRRRLTQWGAAGVRLELGRTILAYLRDQQKLRGDRPGRWRGSSATSLPGGGRPGGGHTPRKDAGHPQRRGPRHSQAAPRVSLAPAGHRGDAIGGGGASRGGIPNNSIQSHAFYPMVGLTGLLHLVSVVAQLWPQAVEEKECSCRLTSSLPSQSTAIVFRCECGCPP